VPDDVNALADRYHEFRLRTNPTWAHLQGDYRFAGQFEQVGRAAEDLDIAAQRDFAAEAEAIPLDGLGPDDRITREMIAWDATIGADILSSRLEEFSVDPIFGPQAMLAVRIPKLTLPTAEVGEAMVGKLNGIATHFTDLADRHRDGVDHGRTPADFAVRHTIDQIDAWLTVPVTEDPLLTTAEPQGVPDREAWHGRLREAIASEVRPALTTYRDTLRDDVLPKARPDEHCGLTWLADGADWIWNEQRSQFPTAEGVLDIFHAAEHLSDAGKRLFGEGSEKADAWLAESRQALLSQGWLGMCDQVGRILAEDRRPETQTVMDCALSCTK
jgi:uncharacterized protein (DUF885 family)